MERQLDVIDTFQNIIDLLKTEALIDRFKVIEGQYKNAYCQNIRLYSVTLAVESTVQSSAQQEIK